MRVADPKLAKSRVAAVQKRKRWTGIRSHFIRTVRGAAPTEGSELIRKRFPSRERAYSDRTKRGAMISVWKRTWGKPATGSAVEEMKGTDLKLLVIVI